MSLKKALLAAMVLATASTGAIAQSLYPYNSYAPYGGNANRGYTVQTPGPLPTFVNPMGNGGYTVQTPGQLPTFVNPMGNGGYTVQTPGHLPTFINPN
jgi:hypothetical protein